MRGFLFFNLLERVILFERGFDALISSNNGLTEEEIQTVKVR
jgi:hypothetical protein